MLQLRPSNFIEQFFRIDNGNSFSFKDREYLLPIYNNSSPKLIIMSSRQAEKSTYLANTILSRAFLAKLSSVLYLSPTRSQIEDFVRMRINPQFEFLPILKKMYLRANLTNRLTDKVLANNVKLIFRSIGRDAVRIRGLTAQELFFDETQNIIQKNIPIAIECAHSFVERAKYHFTGTPLSTKNHFTQLFHSSTQNEWILFCKYCKKYNGPLGINHIDLKRPYLFCQYCGKKIDKNNGEWVAQNPSSKVIGYRISRLMTPNCSWNTKADDGILDKYKNYSNSQFYNEVLGLPYDDGSFVLRPDEVFYWCGNYKFFDPSQVPESYKSTFQVMGVDWAWNNIDGKSSYTIITIATKINDKLKIIYSKRYTGPRYTNPDTVLKEISQLSRQFSVKIIATDHGVGHKENLRLRKMVKAGVYEFMYTSSTNPIQWDKESNLYKLGRTTTMSGTIESIRQGSFEFPDKIQFKPFAADIFNVYSEMDPLNKRLRYENSGPDDFFHTLNLINQVQRKLFY